LRYQTLIVRTRDSRLGRRGWSRDSQNTVQIIRRGRYEEPSEFLYDLRPSPAGTHDARMIPLIHSEIPPLFWKRVALNSVRVLFAVVFTWIATSIHRFFYFPSLYPSRRTDATPAHSRRTHCPHSMPRVIPIITDKTSKVPKCQRPDVGPAPAWHPDADMCVPSGSRRSLRLVHRSLFGRRTGVRDPPIDLELTESPSKKVLQGYPLSRFV